MLECLSISSIDPLGLGEGYRDMADFVARVGAPRARERLSRALEGRGAFRRFKDALLDFGSGPAI